MRSWIAVLLLGCACSADHVTPAKGKLEVSTTSIGFPRTYVGYPTTRILTARNVGRSPLEVVMTVAEPFKAGPSFHLAGGGSVDLPVRFDPPAPGSFPGDLVLAGDGHITVALSGEAVEAPPCQSDDPCTGEHIDPDRGCVISRLPDDTPCGGPCQPGAFCHQGACVGGAKGCDDGDACTADTCNPDGSCSHASVGQACPADPGNPCMVPSCDPATGCKLDPVKDGTACGALGCNAISNHVCEGGQCTLSLPGPDSQCGVETPCRPYGTCDEFGTCRQQQADTLVPVWTREAKTDGGERRVLHFDGVVNVAGTVSWVECAREHCDLVAVSPDGDVLINGTMFSQPDADSLTGHLSLATDRLISTYRPGYLEAYDDVNGDRLFSVELGALVEDSGDVLAVQGAPVVTGDSVLVAVSAYQPPLGLTWKASWLAALAVADGSTRWVQPLDGEVVGLIGDGQGAVHLTQRVGDMAAEMAISVRDRSTLWSQSVDAAPPLGAAAGVLVHGSGVLMSSVTGAPIGKLPFHVGSDTRDALIWSGQVMLYGYPYGKSDDGALHPQFDQPQFYRVDPAAMDTSLFYRLGQVFPEQRSRPVVTRQGELIFAENDDQTTACTGNSSLIALDSSMNEKWVCSLPGAGFTGTQVLLHDRIIMADGCANEVRAFDLKGYDPAGHGWVGPDGGGGRTAAPQ